MSAATLRLAADARRTHWSMAASVMFHVLLVLWLVVFHHPTERVPTLTEIAWLDADPAEQPSAASTAPADAPTAAPAPTALRRAKASDPASLTLDDRMNARLEALQHRSTPDPVAGAAVVPLPSSAAAPAAAMAMAPPSAGPALALRHGVADQPGLELRRVPGAGASAVAAVVATHLPESTAVAPATASTGASARRMLAGASLMGPVSDRAILAQVTPIYPEWAKREAVEASVTLYFVVRSDGSVRENVLVQKTAGFEDFDENARAALRAWRFQALPSGSAGEQWGTITFHFRLRNAG